MLKRLCFIVFFSLIMWGSAWADVECSVNQIVQINCMSSFRSIEVSLRRYDENLLGDYMKLSDNQKKEIGLFDVDNYYSNEMWNRKVYDKICKFEEDEYRVEVDTHLNAQDQRVVVLNVFKNGKEISTEIDRIFISKFGIEEVVSWIYDVDTNNIRVEKFKGNYDKNYTIIMM